MPDLVVVLAAAFALTLLVCLIVQRIRLGKFTLSGTMLGISYLIAAGIVLVVVVHFVGGGVNKWATFVALWLVLFGGGMALLLFAGRKLTARLSGKWQKPGIGAMVGDRRAGLAFAHQCADRSRSQVFGWICWSLRHVAHHRS